MERSDIEDAAMFLLHLRLQRTQVRGLPGEFAPQNLDDAYAIQDATHQHAGWPIAVLKVGCTSAEARQTLGIDSAIGGRIPAEGVFDSGSTIPRSFLAGTPLLECEVALRIGPDGEIDAVAPAIELVNSRFLDIGAVAGPSIVADNSVGAGVVLGAPVALDDELDLAAIGISLHAGSAEVATGSTAALADGVRGSAAWSLHHEAARGRSIDAGVWLITGTCTGLTPTDHATSYRADFGPLGEVRLTLE